MFEESSAVDLHVTLILSRDEYSNIIREIVEYAIDVIREKYCLKISYREIVRNNCEQPILLINELEPLVFNKIPSLESIVKILLAGLRTSVDRVCDFSGVNSNVLTSYF